MPGAGVGDLDPLVGAGAGARRRPRWPPRPRPSRRRGRSRARSGSGAWRSGSWRPRAPRASRRACRCRRTASGLVVSSGMDSATWSSGTRPLASTCRSVIAIASRPSSTCEPASRRVVMSIEVGSTPAEGRTPRGGGPPGRREPAGGVSTRVPNSHLSVATPAPSDAVTVTSTSPPSVSATLSTSVVEREAVGEVLHRDAQVPTPVEVPVNVRVQSHVCRHSSSAMLAVLSVADVATGGRVGTLVAGEVSSSTRPALAARGARCDPSPCRTSRPGCRRCR